jgi:radical SAM superfamily enzyme YgiQ (UPF0313 family)
MIGLDRNYTNPSDLVDGITKKDLRGTKVMLLNMPIREQAKANNAPLGLALLAGRLLDYDVDVKIIDLNAYRVKDVEAENKGLVNGRVLNEDEIESLFSKHIEFYGDQDLIAMSGLVTTLTWQKKVSEIIRKHQPSTMIVSGGGLATEFRSVLFNWIPELNGVAHSEGDDVILKLALDAKVLRKKSNTNLNKLKPYFLGEINGKNRFLYDGGRPSSLDELPLPAWHLLENDIFSNNIIEEYIKTPVWGLGANNSSATPFKMERSLNTVSSRGCPFACKFCFRGAQGERNYGIRSAKNIARELETFVPRYNIDFMGFVDDNFAVSRKRISELFSPLRPVLEEFNIKWGTHARLDEMADIKKSNNGQLEFNKPLRLEQMAKAGCAYIGFGAESANKKVLEEMGKGGFILRDGMREKNGYELPVSMMEGVKNTFNSGVHANCTWIMGYPSEGLDELKASVAFIKWQEELYSSGLTPGSIEYQNAVDSVNKNIFIATAYPGTEMFKHPKVKEVLTKRFSLSFNSVNGDVVPDQNLMKYAESLNDASDVLYDENGAPLYYGDMSEEQFTEVRSHIDSKDIFKILDM